MNIKVVIATEVDHPDRYVVLGEYLYTDEDVVHYLDTYSCTKQVNQDCIIVSELHAEV